MSWKRWWERLRARPSRSPERSKTRAKERGPISDTKSTGSKTRSLDSLTDELTKARNQIKALAESCQQQKLILRTSKGDLFLPLATGVRRRYGAMSITTIEHSAERTRCYVVFHEAYEIGLHHHEQAETVWLLDGVMVEKTTGKMFTAGSVHIYSAGEDHDPAYTVPSTAVIEWRPGLPALSSR